MFVVEFIKFIKFIKFVKSCLNFQWFIIYIKKEIVQYLVVNCGNSNTYDNEIYIKKTMIMFMIMIIIMIMMR